MLYGFRQLYGLHKSRRMKKNVKTRFDTSNYELDRSLPKRKNKKVIAFIKDELGKKIMKEFAALKAKTYGYLTDNND